LSCRSMVMVAISFSRSDLTKSTVTLSFVIRES
jgi:hypothetical protein